MPSINIIAPRRAEKLRRERNLKNIVYAIIGEIAIVMLVIGFLVLRLAALTARTAELDGQIVKLQPKVTQIQKLQQETERLMPKVITLAGAKTDTLFWYNNISAIASCLPQSTWLTSLATGLPPLGTSETPGSIAGSDPTLSIMGVATSHSDVGAAMLAMNQQPGLDHIDLGFDQAQKLGTTDTVTFAMTIHLKPEPAAAGGGDADGKKS